MTWSKGQTEQAVRDIAAAKSGAELLGDVSTAETRFRELQRLVHPDRLGGDEAPLRRLQALRDEVIRPAPSTPAEPVVLTVGRGSGARTYELGRRIGQGQVADVFAVVAGTPSIPRAAKVAGSPADADLLDAEATALRQVRPAGADAPVDRLLPRLHDSFAVRDASGARRRVNVIDRAADGMVTLAQVRAAYPAGLDYRDAAWMIRRMLLALTVAHRRGRVHGAVLPEHVLVHPLAHTALLVGWCGSVEIGQKARLVEEPRRGWYPAEVNSGLPLGPATDLYMVGRCAALLLGAPLDNPVAAPWVSHVPERVPRKVRGLVESMVLASPTRRPDDAFELHEELGEIMRSLCGPPTYRPLAMPAATT